MIRFLCAICVCLMTYPAFSQPPAKYEVATITDVKSHQATVGADPAAASYDVSLKVADTIFVVLYTPPLGMNTVQYAAGRELLVRVDKSTVTYNDILGQSKSVPILSRQPAPKSKRSE